MFDPTTMKKLFNAIDAKDSKKFASFLTEDGLFKWGGLPEVTGRNNIEEFVGNFFQTFISLKHEITNQWDFEGDVSCSFVEGKVTYTLLNHETVAMNFMDVFKYKDNLIQEYYVYADPTELYSSLEKMKADK